MNDYILKFLNSYNTLSCLKDTGTLNALTARQLLISHARNDLDGLANLEKTAQFASSLFKRSPFALPDDVSGSIHLANSENKQVIGMFPEECHLLISGRTGSGKTFLLTAIVSQHLALGQKIFMFAKAKDLRCLMDIDKDILVVKFDGNIKFNPLNPCGLSEPVYCNLFADTFSSQNVFIGTKSFILEQLSILYRRFKKYDKLPSLYDLYIQIKYLKCPSNYGRTASYKESALNRLGGMLFGSLGEVFDCSEGVENFIFDHNCIFEIDTLTTEQQQFVVNLILAKLFYHRINKPSDDWMIVGIDDGNAIFDKSLELRPDFGLPLIHELLSTVRKSRLNIICCTQTPHQIGASIHSNSAIKILMSLSNGEDYEFMFKSIGNLSKEQKEFCYALAPRQVVIKNSIRFPAPVFGEIPEITGIREISDYEVERNNERILSMFPKVVPRYKPEIKVKEEKKPEDKKENKKPDVKETESKNDSKFKSAKDILIDIFNRFEISSSQRAKDLNFSAEASNKIYKFIEKEQFAEVVKLNMTGQRGGLSKYHAITNKGCVFIGKQLSKKYSGGVGAEHVFIQKFYNKYLPSVNFKSVEIEKNFGGKRLDVFGIYEGKKVGIEICVSTFKTEHVNIIKDLDKVDYVFVVATEKKAKLKLEKEIYKIIAGNRKVKICLVHELLSLDYLSRIFNDNRELF